MVGRGEDAGPERNGNVRPANETGGAGPAPTGPADGARAGGSRGPWADASPDRDTPAHDAPAHDAPARDAPARDAPVHHAPAPAAPPPTGGRGAAERLGIDVGLLELLVCPLGGGALVLDAEAEVLISRKARLAFPVRDGVPILAPAEATPLDEHDPRLHPRKG